MTRIIAYFLFFTIIFACNDSERNASGSDEYTGRELTFSLLQASQFPTSGNVTFKERTDYSVEIDVQLTGTEGDALHPVHLHYGNVLTPDADIAVLLNDLSAKTGKSATIVSKLSDESDFIFDRVKDFDGSVKVHLAASGDGRNVILAGGNIGLNKPITTGRISIPVCQSE